MKNIYEITDNNGDVWVLVPTVRAGEKFITVGDGDRLEFYRLKPVKKTEKIEYRLIFSVEGRGVSYLIDEEYEFTEDTANKLSEAISALVEYVQDDTIENHERLMTFAWEARKSFQESQ
jgi:predicted house-cleaning noncanonical NTP pyrophosphatase (MazG superfamily)